MQTQLPGELLERQHREIDRGIEDLRDGGNDVQALAASLALLLRHLYLEEAVLFPPLERAGLTMPVFVMQREHAQMWPLLQSLQAACAAAAPAQLRDPCRELLGLLQVHNPKEEQILYRAADRLAADAADGALQQALADARMPTGWRCALAP